MSTYEYYEFKAIDQDLTAEDQAMLRAISSRAKITNSTFVNEYSWGSFKGDPEELMNDYFDMHLYIANWNSQRLMIRVPKESLEDSDALATAKEIDWVNIETSDNHVIIDIYQNEGSEDFDWIEGEGWLDALIPLRADILSGDYRLLYLPWLVMLKSGELSDDALEPLPGIGPLSDALNKAAEFFHIDCDLVNAAALNSPYEKPTSHHLRQFISEISEKEKTDLLIRVMEDDPHVGTYLMQQLRRQSTAHKPTRRTVAELQALTLETRAKRKRAEKKEREVEAARKAKAEEIALLGRIKVIKLRGEEAWSEVESEITRGNASGYDHATALLSDLKHLAAEEGTTTDYSQRLSDIRKRHSRRKKFLERVRNL